MGIPNYWTQSHKGALIMSVDIPELFHLILRYEGVQRVLAPSIVGHGGCQRGLDHPTLGWWQGPHPLPGAKVDRIPGRGISCPFLLPPLPSCPKGISAFFPFFFTTQSSEKTSFQHNEVILSVGEPFHYGNTWDHFKFPSWYPFSQHISCQDSSSCFSRIVDSLDDDRGLRAVRVYVSIFWWIPLFQPHSCRWEQAASDLHVNEVNENRAVQIISYMERCAL